MIIISRKLLFLLLGVCIFALVVSGILGLMPKQKRVAADLAVTSPAFENNGVIPVEYSGKGDNISIPLEISSIMPEAKSIAIIMDDPDAPKGTFTHWLIWNIPAEIASIPAGIPHGELVSFLGGAAQGKNDRGEVGYTGPMPPSGTHTYRIKAYALDTFLEFKPGADKQALLDAMKGHVLQYGLLKGRFSH